MTPARRDLSLYQGDDFVHRIVAVDAAGLEVDLSGRTFAAQIRQVAGDTKLLATFGIDDSLASVGILRLWLVGAQTKRLGHKAVWDLQELTPALSTLMAGDVTTPAEVTGVAAPGTTDPGPGSVVPAVVSTHTRLVFNPAADEEQVVLDVEESPGSASADGGPAGSGPADVGFEGGGADTEAWDLLLDGGTG